MRLRHILLPQGCQRSAAQDLRVALLLLLVSRTVKDEGALTELGGPSLFVDLLEDDDARIRHAADVIFEGTEYQALRMRVLELYLTSSAIALSIKSAAASACVHRTMPCAERKRRSTGCDWAGLLRRGTTRRPSARHSARVCGTWWRRRSRARQTRGCAASISW